MVTQTQRMVLSEFESPLHNVDVDVDTNANFTCGRTLMIGHHVHFLIGNKLQLIQETEAYFWNSHSLLSSGHTCLVFNHLDMQWKWNAC